jgi:hypothetical protein
MTANPNNLDESTMRLSEFEIQILVVLTGQLRTASEDQLANGLGVGLRRLIRVRRRLENLQLLQSWKTGIPRYELAGPLEWFGVGDALPDFGSIAWQLRKRFEHVRMAPARVVWATARAARIVGGVGGRLRRPLQLDHDLGVAEIWTQRTLETDRRWISEDIFRSWFVSERKVPDALLLDASGKQIKLVLEFGGQYSRKRLEAFHRYWASRAPYEIW